MLFVIVLELGLKWDPVVQPRPHELYVKFVRSSDENENFMKVKFGQTRLPACTHVLTTHHHSTKDGFKIFTFVTSDTPPKLSS
jgi:hypothetical protein